MEQYGLQVRQGPLRLSKLSKAQRLEQRDVDDLFAAANIMRKKKGLSEQAAPDLTKRAIRLKREMRRREREERRRKEMRDQPVEQ